MLDRGELKDWFSSTEIIVEAALAGLGLYLFLVHTATAKRPFIPPRIFRDLNFTAGFLVMFAIGMVLLASSALLAPYLQTLGSYPVAQAGLLMAPRGVGTMVAMMAAGRLANRIDPRLMMLVGFVMMAESAREMTGWTPDIDAWSLAHHDHAAGLRPRLRVHAAAGDRLRDAAGGSAHRRHGAVQPGAQCRHAIGISVASFLLAQNTQIMHAQIAERVTPFNRALQTGGAYLFWNSATPAGLSRAQRRDHPAGLIIAYMDDFKLMLLVALPPVLLMLLMRKPRAAPATSDHVAVVD